MIKWSKHLRHDNPNYSKTFNEIIDKMSDYFDVEVYHTRLNFYKDNSDWKPLHHDSHAYGNKAKREDFTMGASFGFERELLIKHDESGEEFRFPQKNGDIFAFTNIVNQKFMHGVPKSTKPNVGPRFSIIAWGRRKTLNKKNSNNNEKEIIQNNEENINKEIDEIKNDNSNFETIIKNTEVLDIVNNMINKNKDPKKKRIKSGRLQNHYAKNIKKE